MAAVEDVINNKIEKQEIRFEGDENEYRGNWSSKLDFFLSCVGYAVGLGNLWRFPHLCYKNGGGAFLIPYFTMLIIAGIPLFYFELSLGQFSGEGYLTVWKMQPMFKGIGFAMLIISVICSIYYNVIIAWSIYYLFASFTSKLPWSDCNNKWNDNLCFTDLKNVSVVACSSNITTNCTKYEVAAEQYWQRVVLGVVDYSGKQRPMEPYLGPIQWHLSLCLLLAWIICGASLIKGVKSSGKVVYFTALFPYFVIVIMIINGSLLEGSLEGVKYYLIPKWSKLLEARVWGDAATQIFYSLGVAFGGLMTMASYNKFNNNCYRDALLVSIINCATSFTAGFAIFSVLGFISLKTGRTVAETTTSGTGLAFVAYAQGVATMPYSPIWSILFFAMLLTLGIDSQFGGMESIFTGLQDQFPILKKTHFHDYSFKIIFQIILFFLGLPCVSKGGIYMVTLMDEYCGSFSLIIVGFMELVVVSYLYGVKNFIKDVEMMLKFKPGYYWIACWSCITPLIIIFILIVSVIQHKPVSYNGVFLPQWANHLGGVIAVSSILAIPVYLLYHVIFKGITIKPNEEWGPGVKKFWNDDVRYSKKLITHYNNGNYGDIPLN